jgi:cytochrome b
MIEARDWPIRILHWLLAACFLSAFFIAKTVDDDSPAFDYHMLIGMVMLLTIVLRIVWGFLGPPYARWSNLKLHPTALVNYFKGLLRGQSSQEDGHNPASSWAAVAMWLLGCGLAATGISMTLTGNDAAEDLHESMALAFLAVAVFHVIGVGLDAARHGLGLIKSMIYGDVPAQGQVLHAEAGLFAFVLLVLFSSLLWQHYDPGRRSLQFGAWSLALGESEDGSDEGTPDADRETGEEDD